ncbi:OLC1v1032030C1 [Oldenlandia corymbosa var. corymbosa]|uniref:OLC1v1032030C1 n=1 Tax=Oldenlandia corymbosa var. corymbosa TaxID=529605 RepID=A0AAV1CMQ9_OLDCO|nr:OLC1v1032030C1 [Oldenlandia corymbosa var. corymbosa]
MNSRASADCVRICKEHNFANHLTEFLRIPKAPEATSNDSVDVEASTAPIKDTTTNGSTPRSTDEAAAAAPILKDGGGRSAVSIGRGKGW